MKKIGIFLLVILLTLSLTGCSEPEDVNNALDDYCENNPESTLCTNPEATRDIIVSDMVNTIMTEFKDDTNPTFCEDYFANEGLIEQCKNDRYSLVPENVLNLSGGLTIKGTTDISDFEIFNDCELDETCYKFDVSVKELDSILKISKLEYTELTNDLDPIDDIGLTNQEVQIFIHYTINANVNNHTCEDRFIGDALTECAGDFSNMAPAYLMNNYQVSKSDVNKFELTAESFDTFQKVVYSVEFSGKMDDYKISSLSYIILENFNTITHLNLHLDSFKDDYNSSILNLYDVCSYYGIESDISECQLFFESVKSNEITDFSTIDNNGIFEVTMTFDNSTELEMNAAVVSRENGTYLIDFDFGETSVVNPGADLGLTLLEVKNYMATAINYSDTTPCHWKFIDEALNVCNSSSVSEMLAPNHIVYDAVAAEVSTNTYTYTVNSDDLQQQVVYTVVLGGSIDEIRMKDVSFVLTNLYNSLDNVRDLFNDFMMDFNTKSNSLEDVCSNHFINEDVQGCSDFFSVRKNEVIAWGNSLESPGGTFPFNIVFEGSTEQMDISLKVILLEDETYMMDVNFDPTSYFVSDSNLEDSVGMFIGALFDDYYENMDIECDDYFENYIQGNALDFCNQNDIGVLFPDIRPDSIDFYLDYEFNQVDIIMLRDYDDGSFGTIYPNYQLKFNVNLGVLRFTDINISEVPESSDIIAIGNEFELKITNDTLSNSDFCSQIFNVGAECETFRQTVLDGALISFTYKDASNDLGEPIILLEIDVDGTKTEIEVAVGTDYNYLGNTFYAETFRFTDGISNNDPTICEPCVCEVCEPCTNIESMKITHQELLYIFFNEFMNDFNDTSFTNNQMLGKYYDNISNDLLDIRTSILASGDIEFSNLEVIKNTDGSYLYISIRLNYNSDTVIYSRDYYLDVLTIEDGAFKIDILAEEIFESDTLENVNTTFSSFLMDYQNTLLDNAALETKWDSNENLDLAQRFSFLINDGIANLISVELEGSEFVAYYSLETTNEIIYYKQHFNSYVDGTVPVIEFYVLETYIPSMTYLDVNSIPDFLVEYFNDMDDDGFTDNEFCSKYNNDISTCDFRDDRTAGAVYNNVIVTDLFGSAGDDIYGIEFTKVLSNLSATYSGTIKVKQIVGGTFELNLIISDVINNLDANFELGDIDLFTYVKYAEKYINDYYDLTIASDVFCTNYFYQDPLYAAYIEGTQNEGYDFSTCISSRYMDLQNYTLDHVSQIDYLGYHYLYTNNELQLFGIMSYLYYENDIYGFQISYIGFSEDSSAPNGFMAYRYSFNDSLIAINKTQLESFIEDQVAYITTTTDTFTEICNSYSISLPGNNCYQDIDLVSDYEFLDYTYRFDSSYNLYENIIISMNYINPINNDLVTIEFMITPQYDYSYETGVITVIGADYVEPINLSFDFDYDTMFAQLEYFITGYFDTLIDNDTFIETYQNGYGGESLSTIRNTDLARADSPQLVKYMIFESDELIYVSCVIVDGNNAATTMITVYEFDAQGNPTFIVNSFMTSILEDIQ